MRMRREISPEDTKPRRFNSVSIICLFQSILRGRVLRLTEPRSPERGSVTRSALPFPKLRRNQQRNNSQSFKHKDTKAHGTAHLFAINLKFSSCLRESSAAVHRTAVRGSLLTSHPLLITPRRIRRKECPLFLSPEVRKNAW